MEVFYNVAKKTHLHNRRHLEERNQTINDKPLHVPTLRPPTLRTRMLWVGYCPLIAKFLLIDIAVTQRLIKRIDYQLVNKKEKNLLFLRLKKITIFAIRVMRVHWI